MLWYYILFFLGCCLLFYFSGEWVVKSLMRIAKYLGWREFVVAFLVMAFASSLPNLFVGIFSALKGIPQLSFGDIVGGNVIDLTLAIALAVFFAGGSIPAESRTVQTTSIFTIISAILPLFLILDGTLSRIDGVLLIAFFIFYLSWLFSKKERFTKVYDEREEVPFVKEFKLFLNDIGKVVLGIIVLIWAANGIVHAASYFAESLHLPISLIGILIVALGNALPETYFAIASAREGDTWMILGDLMGSIIIPATFVLGMVALIYPIKVTNFSPFIIARFFLIISALFFLFFVRTDRKITKKEAFFLLTTYLLFVLIEILSV